MKPLNLNYNRGIYCNTEGHTVGNTKFVSFLLQKSSFTIKENSENIYELAIFLGSVLQMISQELITFESELKSIEYELIYAI